MHPSVLQQFGMLHTHGSLPSNPDCKHASFMLLASPDLEHSDAAQPMG
jgi:hypothetical protein